MARYSRHYESPGQWAADRGLDIAQNGLYAVASPLAATNLAEGLARAVALNVNGATNQLRALARLIAKNQIPSGELLKAHRHIGQAAQKKTASAFVARHPKRDLPSYRKRARNSRNIRYAGGRLYRAITSPDFFEATPRGINFGNTDRLFKEAKQWARLNYGAGVSNSPARFRVMWGDLVLATVGLEPRSVRAVRVPPGRFVAPGAGSGGEAQAPGAPGTGEFYPLGELRARPGGGATHGRPTARNRLTIRYPQYAKIQPTNFLDAGVREMAREWGPTYQRMYNDHFSYLYRLHGKKITQHLPVPVFEKTSVRKLRG